MLSWYYLPSPLDVVNIEITGQYSTQAKPKKTKKTSALCIASRKVRTIYPGLIDNIQQVYSAHKTDSGCILEANYTFFCQGKSQDKPRQHVVGFAIKRTPLSHCWASIGQIRKDLQPAYVFIIRPSPPLQHFHPQSPLYSRRKWPLLQCIGWSNIQNSQVWSVVYSRCLNASWSGQNDSSQRLLELHCYNGFYNTNACIQCKQPHNVSWRHQHSRHWPQLDLIIIRCADLRNALLTRSYHCADYDTEQLASKVRLVPKKLHHFKKKGWPCMNTFTFQAPFKVTAA